MDSSQKFLLLVEACEIDANVILGMLRDINSQHTFMVEVVGELADGLRHVDRADIVLIDLSLPDSKGIDTFRRLKVLADIPIVVITKDDDGVGLQAVKEGAQDCLVFGQFTANTLLRSILYAIERHRRLIAENRLSEVLSALGEMRREVTGLTSQVRECRVSVNKFASQSHAQEFAGVGD